MEMNIGYVLCVNGSIIHADDQYKVMTKKRNTVI
jgi:hypothetical protein